MPNYRYYYFGRDNALINNFVTEFADDAAAVRIAEEMALILPHGAIEVWRSDRLIVRIDLAEREPKRED